MLHTFTRTLIVTTLLFTPAAIHAQEAAKVFKAGWQANLNRQLAKNVAHSLLIYSLPVVISCDWQSTPKSDA